MVGVRLLIAVDDGFGRDVAPAEVLGQRAPNELAVDARDRAARTARASRARLRRDGLFGELELRFGDIGELELADVRGGLEVARRGAEPANAAGSTALAMTALVGFFRMRLDAPHLGERALRGFADGEAPARRRRQSARRTSSAVGHGARCTEPGRHHDQTSSVTNGRYGANSRSSVDSATSIALLADAAASGPKSP